VIGEKRKRKGERIGESADGAVAENEEDGVLEGLAGGLGGGGAVGLGHNAFLQETVHDERAYAAWRDRQQKGRADHPTRRRSWRRTC
jgi:hypothetical protein